MAARREVSPRTITIPMFSPNGSIIPSLELINYGRARLADDFVLRIRASRATDCADNRPLLDQRNAAARRNDAIKGQQIIEVHTLDTVLEDFRWTPEGRGCSRLVFRNLN
jgi:hypothetical protein